VVVQRCRGGAVVVMEVMGGSRIWILGSLGE
jgi:hypothetical protein